MPSLFASIAAIVVLTVDFKRKSFLCKSEKLHNSLAVPLAILFLIIPYISVI